MNSETTNEGLKSYYDGSKEALKVKDLYEWQQNNPNIRLFYQTERDGYGRTLEEAILNKKLDINVEDVNDKNYWKTNKETNNLIFSIPNKNAEGQNIDNEITSRDIVRATSDNKTDFMYSIILQNDDKIVDFIPDYIKEGLNWLMQ